MITKMEKKSSKMSKQLSLTEQNLRNLFWRIRIVLTCYRTSARNYENLEEECEKNLPIFEQIKRKVVSNFRRSICRSQKTQMLCKATKMILVYDSNIKLSFDNDSNYLITVGAI